MLPNTITKSLPVLGSDWRELSRNQKQTAILTMLNTGDLTIRKLTPIECERLQGLPSNYTAKWIDPKGLTKQTSNTQRYKMLGNGFTVPVIAHILGSIVNGENP